MDYSKFSKEQLIKIIKSKTKYGLVYERPGDNPRFQEEKIVLECDKKTPILERENDRDILFGGENHLLIEGDNYHVLLALKTILQESVDLIYIDPPYNTGSKDFIYNDSFVDKENEYYHSKWLYFMEKRLDLAKSLLKDTGCILISIDEHEFAQLKLLSDSIFGSENFVECFVYDKKSAPKGVPPKTMVASVHEYILCYAKKIGSFRFEGVERSKDGWSNPDNDPRGLWRNTNIKSTTSHVRYDVVDPKTGNVFNDTWACSQENMLKFIEENRIIFPKSARGQVRIKEFFNEMTNKTIPVKTSLGLFDGQWNTEMLTDLFGQEKMFNNAKHLKLMKYIIKTATNKNSIIMDFFAGSGTTGHAVLELNQEDEGKRKFILVTNNEGKIMDNVCYPRIKTIVTGKREDGSQYSDGLENNIIYYKAKFVDKDKQDIETSVYNLMEKINDLLCIKENTYEKIELNSNDYYIYKNSKENKIMAIYLDIFDEVKLDNLINDMNTNKNYNFSKTVYVFSRDNNIDDDTYKHLLEVGKVDKVLPIPSNMYEIYRKAIENLERKY